jgi:hypothetical protein
MNELATLLDERGRRGDVRVERVGPMLVVMGRASAEYSFQVFASEMSNQSRHWRPTLPTHRSALSLRLRSAD